MAVSFTKLSRYYENPARAYAHYELHDVTAYPINNQEALVYGRILHDEMAGINSELREEEEEVAYKYGKKERGLKASFKTIENVIYSMSESLADLYSEIGIDIQSVENYKNEVEFKNDLFNGRFDYVDYKNHIIVDWKTTSPRTDFDKAWSDRDGTYTSWIHSTLYDIQAFIYLYSIAESTGESDWNYYVIAATKSNNPVTRVIDMSNVLNNFELQDLIENTLQDIKLYETGNKTPEILNDKSDWYFENKPFEIEVY